MAAAIRIRWAPPTAQVVYFVVYRLDTPTSAEFEIARIGSSQTGANWDGLRFFYDDPQGVPANAYRVTGINGEGDVLADTGIFMPQPSVVFPLITRVKLDTHFGGVDQLRYLSPGGAPVPHAKIAVYRKIDYDQGLVNIPLFRTETDTQGRWLGPFFVEPGFDYVVHFSKQSEWGPNVRTVTVPPLS
jgi:hypothetical protein